MLRRVMVAGLVVAFGALAVPFAFADDDDPDKGHPERVPGYLVQRFIPKAAGTEEKQRWWFGPYVVPPGHDANRVDVSLPVRDGYIVSVEPHMRRTHDISEPSHQEAHIHHAHWFALDPGNEEDNYTGGNTEWIFGNGDEETKADFAERSAADPKGPIYGQYVGAAGPQAMIYMLHNKTSAPLNVYVVLDVTFVHGTKAELAALPRPYHDITGVLFGRTFDVPRKPDGPGEFTTTRDMEKPIEWVATHDATMLGTGGHLHPGGIRVIVENMGSKENPCPNDGRGTGGTQLLSSDALWRNGVRYSEDFQMEVTHPSWRAPIHKGDRIRITGVYENRLHAWYTAMTHEGIYIDEQQKPVGRCTPYLINQPTVQGRFTRVRKKIVTYKMKRVRVKKASSRKARASGKRWKMKRVKVVKVKWVRKRVPGKPLDPTAGVPNRPWGVHSDRVCGTEYGALPCDRPEPDRGLGQLTDTVHIANFLYLPGDRSLTGEQGAPARVPKGTSLSFVNEDQVLGIRHSVTTCAWPCNGQYVANYPLADGVWDSTTLGYDAVDGGNPNPIARTPPDLAVGKYSYFCRIHPWMRGAFEVVE